MLNITFSNDPKTKKFILSIFNKTVNDEGTIIEKDTNRSVLDINGQEITIERLGGVSNGSEIYVKDDIVSLVDFYRKKDRNGGF